MQTMQHAQLLTERLRTLPSFATASDDILTELTAKGNHQEVPAGLMTSLQGSQCLQFPIVVRGSFRVFTMGENGREITLYRLAPGDGCVLAAASILSGLPLPAFAVTETDGDILMVPAAIFQNWFDHLDFWRKFVFSLIAHNLANVIAVTNATAFSRLDARVASHLLETPGVEVKTTHQAIAVEVGSSREVISRMLKSFEVEGLIKLHRGSVRFLDRGGLATKAELA